MDDLSLYLSVSLYLSAWRPQLNHDVQTNDLSLYPIRVHLSAR